jgi:hypothetical protein
MTIKVIRGLDKANFSNRSRIVHRAEVTLMTLGRSKAAKSRKVEIAFHSDNATGSNAHPAINVKVHNVIDVDAPEEIRQQAYDGTVAEFWDDAKLIAQNHGYSGVFSEGRSNGWLVPYTQHDSTGKLVTDWTGQGPDKGYPVYPNADDLKERKQFVKFRTDIEGLLRDSMDRYRDLALELTAEESNTKP